MKYILIAFILAYISITRINCSQSEHQPLVSGTYLNEYNPNTNDYHGNLVLCDVDNENPPVTGAIIEFTPVTVRILLTLPTHPNYEGITDTYANPHNCIVL